MTTGATSQFVVVANRLPVDHVVLKDGTSQWKQSPGGLVTALEPILRTHHGAWVGWSGTPDTHEDPFVANGLNLYPVPLTSEDVERYYEGFSNATLWPLYHDVVVRPIYDRTWWSSYVAVNQRFAHAAAEIAGPDAMVWIQDYQLQLVPKMLRELRPDVTIGFFQHIPFPPIELFMQLPWRREIVEGLLGADLIGFHLPGGAQNFLYLANRLTGRTISRGSLKRHQLGTVEVSDERTAKVGAFPISIDSGRLAEAARQKDVRDRAQQIRHELGDPKRIMLGVDRLDYTKGIDVRLTALGELFAEGTIDPDDVVVVQLATPSRERVENYTRMRNEIEREVGRINGEFGRVGHPVVHYLHRPVAREELTAYYVAADVMLVTPFRDGMNLVAKEYVACRTDQGGALVLSEFAGAAAELHQALLCNPHDPESVKAAIYTALTQDPALARHAMRTLRRQVLTHDVDRWARAFMDALTAQKVNTD